jgi:4a-hydroxytetrahydrobiopterin dehydratase
MGRPGLLSTKALEDALRELPGWSVQHGKLHRELEFRDFVEAFAFMSAMALVSESLNHHPEWRNVYRHVVVELTTHDAAGITSLDVDWARKAEALSWRLRKAPSAPAA